MASTVRYTGQRNGSIETEAALVYNRAELDRSTANMDESRLNTKVNNAEFLISQSDDPKNDTEVFKEWVTETCLTSEAIHGNENSKYQCPLVYANISFSIVSWLLEL